MIGPVWMHAVFLAFTGLIIVRARRSNTPLASTLLQVAFAFYATRVVALTFFPIPFDAEVLAFEREMSARGFGQSNNFTLFETVRETPPWDFNRQIFGNLVLLTPLGLLAPLLWLRFQLARNAAALVIGTAFAIESLQFLASLALGFTFRSFDVDDLWLNSLGGLAGAAVGVALGRAQTYTRLRSQPPATEPAVATSQPKPAVVEPAG